MVSQSSPTVAPASAMTRDAGLFWLRASGDASPSYRLHPRLRPGHVPAGQGEWTHLAGVFDGTNARIYVNGTLERSTSAPGRVAAMRPEYRLQIGAAPVDERPGIGRRAGAHRSSSTRPTTSSRTASGSCSRSGQPAFGNRAMQAGDGTRRERARPARARRIVG